MDGRITDASGWHTADHYRCGPHGDRIGRADTGSHVTPTLAAGMPPIRTVGQPGGRIGPLTCGGGVTIGHVCMSPTLAAGGINQLLS
jgi:hypothetical protein